MISKKELDEAIKALEYHYDKLGGTLVEKKVLEAAKLYSEHCEQREGMLDSPEITVLDKIQVMSSVTKTKKNSEIIKVEK